MANLANNRLDLHPGEIRFAAEKTVGKLSKWLRILGFDTIYEPEIPARRFADIAKEGRILLTRTKQVYKKNASTACLFISSNDPIDQLKEIVKALSLTAADLKPFSRCIRCNVPISGVAKAELKRRIPDYIWETHEIFHRCELCRRIYWPGTHIRRSRDVIQTLFPAVPPETAGLN